MQYQCEICGQYVERPFCGWEDEGHFLYKCQPCYLKELAEQGMTVPLSMLPDPDKAEQPKEKLLFNGRLVPK